jgi:TatA/E family protein of Tat protein translocase
VLSLSPIKILIIVAVVLLLLGPDKLPDVAHRLGSSWRALKRLQERVESEVRSAIPDLPSTNEIARIARSPVNLLNQLAANVDAKEESAAAEASKSQPTAPPASEVPPAPPSETVAPPIPRPESTILPPDPSLN